MKTDEAMDTLRQAVGFCAGRQKSPPTNKEGMAAVIEMVSFIELVRRLYIEIVAAKQQLNGADKVSVKVIFGLNDKIKRTFEIGNL